MFLERLTFYGKCLLLSCVYNWGAAGILREFILSSCVRVWWACCILREIPLIAVCLCFRCNLQFTGSAFIVVFPYFEIFCHFMGYAFHRRVSMFQERLACYGKHHLSWCFHVLVASSILREMPFVAIYPRLRSAWYFTGNAFYRLVSMSQEHLAFTGNAFIRRVFLFHPGLVFYWKCLLSSLVHVLGASGILLKMPSIVMFQCLSIVWHFMGNAFYPRFSIFWDRLAHYGKCPLSPCVHVSGASGNPGNVFYRCGSMLEDRVVL